MGGKCLNKRLSCECGSSDGIQVFLQDDGTEDGYCFACGKYYNASDIKGEPQTAVVIPMVRQETKMDLNKIKNLPSSEIADRKLSKDTVEHFSVRVEHSEETGEIIKHYYPDTRNGDIVGYEVRDTRDKKFSAVGDRKGDIDLWGSHLTSSGKKLFITEGRLDAMSLFQSIIENRPAKYSKYTPAVVSLTRGAQGAASDLINNRKYLKHFDEIILCFDMDQAGQKALRDCIKIFPTAKAVTLPLKDASDMLVAGRSAELFDLAVWNAQPVRMGERKRRCSPGQGLRRYQLPADVPGGLGLGIPPRSTRRCRRPDMGCGMGTGVVWRDLRCLGYQPAGEQPAYPRGHEPARAWRRPAQADRHADLCPAAVATAAPGRSRELESGPGGACDSVSAVDGGGACADR